WHLSSAALLARQGLDLLICLSSSPARGVAKGVALGSERSYDLMTRTYAQLLTTYVSYCNRVGYEDGVAFWGGSRVVASTGEVVGGPADDQVGTTVHRLDRGTLRRARIVNPLVRDERHD